MKIETPEKSEETAPSPQFLPFTHAEQQEKAPEESKPVTCSLRTILPRTVPQYPHDDEHIFEHPINPTRACLQRNLTAERNTKEHIITWSRDDNILPDSLDGNELEKQGRGRDTASGEFVRNMKVGDVVTVWAKARFPGWANVIEQVKVDVYWAV
jgi:hypothetical protein